MLCVLFAFALAYDSEHRQCASQLAGCSFSLLLRSLYIPLFSFLMISSSAKDFGNRRFEILRSCPQGTGRIRNSGTSCGIGGGGVGERNEKGRRTKKEICRKKRGNDTQRDMRPRPWGQEGLLAFPSQVHIRSFLLRRGKRSLHFLPTLLLPLLPSPTLALSSVFQRRWRLAKRPREFLLTGALFSYQE